MTADSAGPAAAAEELSRIVSSAIEMLRTLPSIDDARLVETQWTTRQIIGHLIDSAANNHARFVRAQIEEDMVFGGYAQDEWVEIQAYDDEPLEDLIDLWTAYNRHLAHVIARIEPLEWSRPRARHNLDHIGFASVEASRLGSLGWLVIDYLAHLRHHLDKISSTAR